MKTPLAVAATLMFLAPTAHAGAFDPKGPPTGLGTCNSDIFASQAYEAKQRKQSYTEFASTHPLVPSTPNLRQVQAVQRYIIESPNIKSLEQAKKYAHPKVCEGK